MDLNKINSVYFVGIGGIGMSALARYFNHKKVKVHGYDKTSTALTKLLEKEGMKINYEDNISNIPEGVELVIYTPAIPKEHQQLNYFLEKKFTVKKRSEILEIISKDKFTIAVAGSHGKTTVTTMIAHILKHAAFDCTAFLGGISINYNSNFLFGNNNVIVVEADEFDRSFLRLNPDIAVITAVDTDHLDIYGSRENIENAFLEFTGKIKKNGALIAHSAVPILGRVNVSELIKYGLKNSTAECTASGFSVVDGQYCFDVSYGNDKIEKLTLPMGGKHNVENALAACAVAKKIGIEDDKIRAALAQFKGIRRRFEYIIQSPDLVFIDDYAHHPEEISALLTSVRELYPSKKITVIFQPHLFSRTYDLHLEFASALNKADEVILLDIYPARERPVPGVTSKLILDEISLSNKSLVSKESLFDFLIGKNSEVLLTVGAGDIDALVEPLRQSLTAKK